MHIYAYIYTRRHLIYEVTTCIGGKNGVKSEIFVRIGKTGNVWPSIDLRSLKSEAFGHEVQQAEL